MAAREELRQRIASRREARKSAETQKFAKMVAASKSPEKVAGLLASVESKLSSYAEGVANLRDHLDLIKASKDAPLKVRVAAARNFGKGFRLIAEQEPGKLADALTEAYKGLDEIAAGLEMAAQELGISLDVTPAEEALAVEGEAEIELGEPEGEAVVDDGEIPPEVEEPMESEPEEEKEASGSDMWVTDRDNSGQPNTPAKAAIPQSQGESELNKKGGVTSGEPPQKFVKDIPQSQGQSEENKRAAKKATPAGKQVARGSL
jgi:hypothetical protein